MCQLLFVCIAWLLLFAHDVPTGNDTIWQGWTKENATICSARWQLLLRFGIRTLKGFRKRISFFLLYYSYTLPYSVVCALTVKRRSHLSLLEKNNCCCCRCCRCCSWLIVIKKLYYHTLTGKKDQQKPLPLLRIVYLSLHYFIVFCTTVEESPWAGLGNYIRTRKYVYVIRKYVRDTLL